MTLRVGRAGFDAAEFLVNSWNMSGDEASVSGWLLAWSADDVAVLRQQLNGYVDNPDEPVVPVTWSEDPTVDGFYRVSDVSVGAAQGLAPQGAMTFSLSLHRVSGYSAPIIETTIVGAVRDNAHGITAANARAAIGVPDAVTEFSDTATTDSSVRSSSDGAVRVTSSATMVRRQTWSVEPEDYYDGSARITVDDRVVVGRQVPAATDNWTLSNGIIRLSIDSSFRFLFSNWTGTAWSQPRALELTANEGGAPLGLTAAAVGVRVLRNSPEECTIRLTLTPDVLTRTTVGELRAHVDVAVRRGERMMRLLLSTTMPVKPGAQFGSTSGAVLAGGYEVNASGSAPAMSVAIPQAHTVDLPDGGFWLNDVAATEMAFGVGPLVGGWVAQSVIYEYYAATSERAVVASR